MDPHWQIASFPHLVGMVVVMMILFVLIKRSERGE